MKVYLAIYTIKDKKALKKPFVAMKNQVNLERNKIFHLEDSMVMNSIYNSEKLEKLINTVHMMHDKTIWNEKLFVGKLNNWYQWYLSKDGVENYAINSLLYITTLREKSVKDVCQCNKSTFKGLFANLSFAFNEITGNFK